jgi:hypothetical protein
VHLSPSTIEELRVPVQRAEAELQTERDVWQAVIFLTADGTPEDLFEQEAPFFPAEVDGVVRFFARTSIVRIVVDAAASESLSALGVPHDERAVVVHLGGGRILIGAVRSVGRTRTLDVLNQPSKSFALHTEGKIHHIAKAHVVHVVELR